MGRGKIGEGEGDVGCFGVFGFWCFGKNGRFLNLTQR